MQTNTPQDTNPYIGQNTQNTQNVDNTTNADLGLQNTNPYINTPNTTNTTSSLLGSFNTNQFLLGALVGVAGAYLLTNEKAQKAIFKTVAKGGAMFSAGIEEMKERYEDAQAELDAEHNV